MNRAKLPANLLELWSQRGFLEARACSLQAIGMEFVWQPDLRSTKERSCGCCSTRTVAVRRRRREQRPPAISGDASSSRALERFRPRHDDVHQQSR